MCALQKQYDYYHRNMSALMEDYEGKFLVISENLDVHAFNTISEAYSFGAKNYGLGNFLLQECTQEANQVKIISNLGLGVA